MYKPTLKQCYLFLPQPIDVRGVLHLVHLAFMLVILLFYEDGLQNDTLLRISLD